MARLRGLTREDFDKLPGGPGGLGDRLYHAVKTSASLAQVLEKAKTKKFAMSALKRGLMCAVLGILPEEQKKIPPYIKVLAFTKKGQMILAEISRRSRLPLVSKPAAAKKIPGAARFLMLDELASNLYGLCVPKIQPGGNEWTTSPKVLGDSEEKNDLCIPSR